MSAKLSISRRGDDWRRFFNTAQPGKTLLFALAGDQPAFMKMLSLTVEQERRTIASEQANAPASASGGRLLGKLFGR